MARNSSGFTALNRAATVVTLVVSAGFIVFGFVAELPWVIAVFAIPMITALAVVPRRAAPAELGARNR